MSAASNGRIHLAPVKPVAVLGNYSEIEKAFFDDWLKRQKENSESARKGVDVRSRVMDRRFNFAAPPVEPIPRFLINGKAVCTPGNITNLIAQAKIGKSAFMAALTAAAICAGANVHDRDTLGVTATDPEGKCLIGIDTEQSPWDHDQLVRRSLARAGWEGEPPGWLRSYGLAGFSPADLRTTVRELMAEAHKAEGVFAMMIDGVADLASNINDLEEACELTAELHSLAIRYNCPIVSVIHDNEGRDPNGDGRGHLGKQLMRKAESNLRLKKHDEVTVVFSEKMRRAPIFESEGPRFKWSDAAGMHVSVESAGATRDDAKREKMRDLAEAVFATVENKAMRFADLLRTIATVRGVKASAAEDRFRDMKKLGVIAKNPITHAWEMTANPVTL